MARSLSWIDAAEWNALLGDVQPRHERGDTEIDDLGDSVHGFETRRPARSARTARPPVSSPAHSFEDSEPVKAAPATRRRPQEAPARPAPRAAAPVRKPIAQAAPPASAPMRPVVATKPAPVEAAAPEPARLATPPMPETPAPGSYATIPSWPPQPPMPRVAESAPVPAVTPVPAAVSVPPATPVPAVEATRTLPAIEPFQPSAGAEPLEYLDEYLEWLTAQAQLDGAVIADANGLAIAERHTSEIDAAVSGSIDMLLHHLGTVLAFDPGAGTDIIDGHVALQHNGRHIIVIWAPTDYGRLYGVLVGESAPAPEALAAAAETLRSLFAS